MSLRHNKDYRYFLEYHAILEIFKYVHKIALEEHINFLNKLFI